MLSTGHFTQKTKPSGSSLITYDTGDFSSVWYRPRLDHKKEHLVAKGQYLPTFSGDTITYVCGRRGAGKSTWCNQFLHSYLLASGDHGRVFVISRFSDDPSLILPPDRSMRLTLDDLSTIELSELHHSLIIFDDIHSASYTPQQRKFLDQLIIDVIENSRHWSMSALITSHLITNYAKTRAILNECSSLVIFPFHSNRHQIEYALKNYYGMSRTEMEHLFQLTESRWVQVNVISPKVVLTQHEVYTW